MRTWLLLTLLTLPLPALADAPATLENLDAQRFKAAAEAKHGLLLDVRTPGEVARGKLAGASVIDFNGGKFEQKVALLAKDKPIFVYCASGNRSGQAAAQMQKLGFREVYNLTGGMRAWNAAGLPVEQPTEAVAPGAGALEPKALDALLKAEKKLLVDYQTPWCGPCQKMAPVVDALAEALKGKVKVLRVDVDQSEALAAREKIEGVPVFIYYVDGKERWRRSGEQPRAELEKALAQ